MTWEYLSPEEGEKHVTLESAGAEMEDLRVALLAGIKAKVRAAEYLAIRNGDDVFIGRPEDCAEEIRRTT